MKRTGAINIRVTPELKQAAERAAATDHRSVASMIEKLLTEFLIEQGALKPPRTAGLSARK